MGCVFRRKFRDKQTGKTKQIKTYSIKYQDASGQWVTEPTDCINKLDARRILAERELQIKVTPPPPPNDAPADTPAG